MKPIFWTVFGCLMLGCSASQSTETSSSQDTLKLTASNDSVGVDSPPKDSPPKESPIVTSDSLSNALDKLVRAQFDSVYKALADSANYYKVTMDDYYDEYEGQAELWRSTWFFDKNFSIIYGKYTDQNGAMERPYIKEYILRNGSIICEREDSDFTGSQPRRSVVLWDQQAGGVELNSETFGTTVVKKVPIPDDYAKTNLREWEVNFSKLESTLEEAKVDDQAGDVYTILIEVPKASELKDYTEVVIPKAIFEKLRSNKEQ